MPEKKQARDDGEGGIQRGLPSVSEARAERRRLKSLPPQMWLWALVCIGAGVIVWWKLDEGEINKMKSELLARQRVVVEELGPRWLPLRDKIERWTTECAAEEFTEVESPLLAKTWDFRKMPGIYLRLAQSAATSPATVREAAQKSLKDGFTACLLVVDNPSPLAGAACQNTDECPPKHLCNEFNHCAEPSQPLNLRLAYKALFMLTDEWVADTQAVANKLTMRGAVATFDVASKYDLPIATDLLARSQYFLAVVDEGADADETDIDGTLPEVDGGAQDDRSIPTAPHHARVCVWRLSDDKKMIAVRREANGQLRGPAGGSVNPATMIAQRRQANSCALALALREAMGAEAGATVEDREDGDAIPEPSPAPPTPSATPSGSP